MRGGYGKHRILQAGWFLLILLVAVLLFQLPVNAAEAEDESAAAEKSTPSKNYEYRTYDYVIDAYDTHVVLHENNTLEVTENLTVMMRGQHHGIYRLLPKKCTVFRQDGSSTTKRIQVTGVSADGPFQTETEGNNLKLRIGDAANTVTGEQHYTIHYTYNLGRDPLDDMDEFYFNLVGSEWTAPIGNITFTIEMPKEFDSRLLGFTAGWEKTVNTLGISWDVDGTTITGKYSDILLPGQALTVRTELPEGYFVGAGFPIDWTAVILYSVVILFLIISVILWFVFGKDDIVVDTVEFYPPDDLNSLDTAYLYKGSVKSKDVTSLLIYLANKGYISIENTDDKPCFLSDKAFRIVKLKDYDGDNPEEKTFMNGMFMFKKPVDGKVSVTSGQLYGKFYKTTESILGAMNRKEKQDAVFESNLGAKRLPILIMLVLSLLILGAAPFIGGLGHEIAFATLFVSLIATIAFVVAFYRKGKGYSAEKSSVFRDLIYNLKHDTYRVVIGFLVFLVVATVLVVRYLPTFLDHKIYLYGFFAGIPCILGMVICYFYMPRRTEYGIKMLGRINGFRNFLMVAEKDELEQLVMEDPEYYYKILPYTYVLGVSDTWIRKFEVIQMTAPTWYVGTYTDTSDFSFFLDHAMETTDRAMTVRSHGGSDGSSYSSSSSDGGGGFSGGGWGGGGGGVW